MLLQKFFVACLVIVAAGVACQDYPFELRIPKRVTARKVSEVVATVRPTDILLVIDSSGTMAEERAVLKQNVERFVEELVDNRVDFHLGIVVPDMECNLPSRSCGPGSSASRTCCLLNPPACSDDLPTKSTTCDGGRLRKASGGTNGAYFTRPARADIVAFKDEINATLDSFSCKSSPYEAAFETAVAAVACSVGAGTNIATDCPGGAAGPVAQINAGFIRDGADLVIIFMSDEDDCSFRGESFRYGRPLDPTSSVDQNDHLCDQSECYAYYGSDLNGDGTPPFDWSDTSGSGARGWFDCEGNIRQVDPPMPSGVGGFIDSLITYKAVGTPSSTIKRVRAAAISGAVADPGAELGARDAGCFRTVAAPSDQCGCSSIFPPSCSTCSDEFFCDLTDHIGQFQTPVPSAATADSCGTPVFSYGGCESLPGRRYRQFLEALADRRVTAGAQPDALLDSICQFDYSDTLSRIVNNVILSNCFTLPEIPADPDYITVRLNGQDLPRVPDGSTSPGYSYLDGSTEICLEGGVKKTLDDRFEIIFVTE
jgi:hypothetical protein